MTTWCRPAGFWWGTGASSTQTDGAAPASDWWDRERAGHAPISGDGNGFATRYAEDFALLGRLGPTHHHRSIEWARIEPAEGHHDRSAIAHYRGVLEPDLIGAYDLIGFSYYSAMGVRDGKMTAYPTDAPRSPLGYAIGADGLAEVLDRLADEVPDSPLLVAEYGIGTDDDVGRYAGVSRIGLAISDDGFEFALEPEPVLFPDDDAHQAWEWPGGLEDPRVVASPEGGYVCTYTAFDGKNGALFVATSADLRTWVKHGPASAGTAYPKRTSKSGAILTEAVRPRASPGQPNRSCDPRPRPNATVRSTTCVSPRDSCSSRTAGCCTTVWPTAASASPAHQPVPDADHASAS